MNAALTSSGTATAAMQFMVVAMTAMSPTASAGQAQLDQWSAKLSLKSQPVTRTSDAGLTSSVTFTYDPPVSQATTRETTAKELLLGEIREWATLLEDWDGEGSKRPSVRSIAEAVSFMRLLDETVELPEPMLLSSGHTSLFWNEGGLYADIEFLGDNRIAYFVESKGDKHKGVVAFDSQQMPAMFPVLLRSEALQ